MTLAPDIVGAIARRLAEHAGLELPAWVIEARAEMRIEALGVAADNYAALLDAEGGSELDRLTEAVRVGETRLFRHRKQIETLADVIAPALRGKKLVRAWSAGCAAGEEPYTLAVVLAKALPESEIEVIATDVSAVALAAAAQASYPKAALDDVPEAWRDGFIVEGERVRVRPELAARVAFQRANLVDGPAPRDCDLVWCRNVLIYFTPAARAAAVERLVAATVQGGYVFVGYSESLRDVPQLETRRTGEIVYYVRRDEAARWTPLPAGLRPQTPAAGTPALTRTPPALRRPPTGPEPLVAPDLDDLVALAGAPDPAELTSALGKRLAAPGLRRLVIDFDGADMLPDELAAVVRRAAAAARSADIELVLRATRTGAKRWLSRHGARGATTLTGEGLWTEFVATSGRDAERLAREAVDRAGAARAELAQVAFRIGLSSLLMGAEDVAKLAIAIEAALDRGRDGKLDAGGWAALQEAVAALAAAFHQLANADKSGARVEGLDLEAAVQALVDATPRGVSIVVPSTLAAAAAVPAVAGAFTWAPTVDDDMLELFFDEANERLEALSGKLVDIERNPTDGELLREIFRDMHTVKGSSAMVGLVPVNQLAHAAEDLVGQVRDAGRAVDAGVIDALLAALDSLRAMMGQARARTAITIDPVPSLARLRNPGAPPPAAAPRAIAAASSGPVAAPTGHAAEQRQTIRVDFEKLDRLLNLVGELVLGRDDLRTAISSLGSLTSELAADRGVVRRVASLRVANGSRSLANLGDDLSRVERVLAAVTSDLDHGNDRLDAISEELREQVMRLRMIPIAGVFRKHVRTVRDLAAHLGKHARLELVGEDTELDKLLVEALDEPLMHLVRNSVDHGIETPEGRASAGKPDEGIVTLTAAHRGNQVEIRISDDGRGLDPAKLKARAVERRLITPVEAEAMDDHSARELIFRAGFSTAVAVSDVSGRGVGMDVVRQTVVTKLKGTIDVESTPGQGSAFMLKLPLTLAIIQVLVARAGGETFAIPLDIVHRVLTVGANDVELIGDREVCVVRGHHVPLVRLDHVLELDGGGATELQIVLVVLGGHTYALACEHLVGKREIVIKSLGKLLAHVPCVAGATLLGDRVALLLDVPAIIARALATPATGRARTPRRSASTAAGAHVLLVEDSDVVREALRRLLADAGYRVTVAVDGVHGLELAQQRKFDLVSTDVMMPRMDGYELTRTLRAMPEYADTPIVMVTSMGERIDRVRGFDAGVDEYITKPHDRQLLLRAVRKLLGHADPNAGSEPATEPPPEEPGV